MKTKNGRPPKTTEELRSETVWIRITTAEKKAFQDSANVAGASLSVWARERLRRVAVRELEDAQVPVAFLRERNDGTETTD
jgi:hypothetical protein